MAGVALSVAVGVAREVVQNWGDADNDVLDSIADALAWASGPAAGALIVEVVLWRREKAARDVVEGDPEAAAPAADPEEEGRVGPVG